MVYTGLPYSSWKGRSETKGEEKERHKIQQKKREEEEQIRKRQIENDLTFAKERYGTIGVCNYIIPDKDLPKDFKTSGAIIRVIFLYFASFSANQSLFIHMNKRYF